MGIEQSPLEKMVKLEDLKGRKIVDAKVAPYMPPEEVGQLELRLDDGKTVTIMRGVFGSYGDTIVEIDSEIVYQRGSISYEV